jgi:putative methanogen marker protein 4
VPIITAGLGENRNIIKSSKIFEKKYSDVKINLIDSEKEFLEDYLSKKSDAYIRGSLNASQIMKHLRKYNKIYRTSLIEINNHKFLLAPVGIDEGANITEKIKLIEHASNFLKKINKEPKIAILSGGRHQDKGRSPQIDKTINDAEKLVSTIKNKYLIKHYYILIENAINDNANLILAPDGISGNLIFRTLVLVGSAKSYGAITLGINQIFIDTSRAQSVEGYLRAFEFAYYLSKTSQ